MNISEAFFSTMKDLKPCPCGRTPIALGLHPGATGRWAFVFGNCCSKWNVEFLLDYTPLDSEEAMEFAIEAWNNASRKQEE